MRTICPRCGVTSKDEAEFCVSCGQPLKSAVSSIPPTRAGARPPVSEVNVNNVVEENAAPSAGGGAGVKSEVSVRYRTISTNPKPAGETGQPMIGSAVDNLRETILLHAPTSRAPDGATSAAPRPQPVETAKVYAAPVAEREEPADAVQSLQTINVNSVLAERASKRSPHYGKTTGETPSLGIQHIWYRITGDANWSTIAIIPASDDLNPLSIAHGLGVMAVREPCEFVRVVNASLTVFEKAEAKAKAAGDKKPRTYPYEYFDLVKQLHPEATSAEVTQLTKELLAQFDKARETGTLRDGKVFVTIDSISSYPDAIALCRAVDKLIICVRLGATRLASVRKIIETVGHEKILGCVALNPVK